MSPVCDLLITGAEVVAEHGARQANVVVSDGVIAEIGDAAPRARRRIDAEGLVLLPGGVDPHTHLNSDWPFMDERRPADGFLTGTRAAAAGGITTVCDFVYHLGDEGLVDAAERVRRDAMATACVDVALHVVVSELRNSFAAELEPLVAAGFPSFKFYTQLSDFVRHAASYIDLFVGIGAARGLSMFHCEDAAIIDYCCRSLATAGKSAPRHYPESKPPEVEESATAWVLNLASVASVPAYIVHLSSSVALDLAVAARARGSAVIVETRPLYLHLTADSFDAPDEEAALFIGTPPLREDADRKRLWDGIATGEIEVVGSDHVGFTRAQKYCSGDTLHTVPKGVSNLETMIPMLYSEGVRTGRISLERLAQITSTGPAKIFGLYPRKGVIREGSDADLCLLDPNERRIVAGERHHSAADFDLFDGIEVTGWPVLTVSRGDIVYEQGAVRGEAGRGRFVPGEPFQAHQLGGREI
jgi:dihydropyrimidinase